MHKHQALFEDARERASGDVPIAMPQIHLMRVRKVAQMIDRGVVVFEMELSLLLGSAVSGQQYDPVGHRGWPVWSNLIRQPTACLGDAL